MSAALALAAHPRRAPAPLSRAEAIAAHRAGRVVLAAGAYDSLLAAAPDDAELHHLRGVIDGEAGDPGRAVRRLRRAIDLDDAVARYHVDLAVALHALGRLEEAGEAASRAVVLDPQSAAGWSALGAVGVARGDGDAALEALGRAVALDPANAAAQRARGILLRARGRLAEARGSFRSAIAAEPRSAAAANELGITYGLSGDPAAAAAWYAMATNLDPTFVDPLLNLAELRERGGYHEAAIFHLRRALLVAPESVRVRWRLALALLRVGRFAEGWALHEHGIGIAGFRGPARRAVRCSGARATSPPNSSSPVWSPTSPRSGRAASSNARRRWRRCSRAHSPYSPSSRAAIVPTRRRSPDRSTSRCRPPASPRRCGPTRIRFPREAPTSLPTARAPPRCVRATPRGARP